MKKSNFKQLLRHYLNVYYMMSVTIVLGFLFALLDKHIFDIFIKFDDISAKSISVISHLKINDLWSNYSQIVLYIMIFLTYIFWIKYIKPIPVIRDIAIVIFYVSFASLVYFLAFNRQTDLYDGFATTDFWKTSGFLVLFFLISISNMGGILERNFIALKELISVLLITFIANLPQFLKNGFSPDAFIEYFVYVAMVYIISIGVKIMFGAETIVTINLERPLHRLGFYALTLLILMPLVGLALAALFFSFVFPDASVSPYFLFSPIILPAAYMFNLFGKDFFGFIMLIYAVSQTSSFYFSKFRSKFASFDDLKKIDEQKTTIKDSFKRYFVPDISFSETHKAQIPMIILGILAILIMLAANFLFIKQNNNNDWIKIEYTKITHLNSNHLENIDSQLTDIRTILRIEGWEYFFAEKFNDTLYCVVTQDSIYTANITNKKIIARKKSDLSQYALSVEPLDNKIVVFYENKLRIFDTLLNNVSEFETKDEISEYEYFPKKNILLIGDLSGIVYFLRNFEPVFSTKIVSDKITAFALFDDGAGIAAGSVNEDVFVIDTTGKLIFSVQNNQTIAKLKDKKDFIIRQILISQKRKNFIAVSKSVITFWSFSGEKIKEYKLGDSKNAIISNDEKYLLCRSSKYGWLINLDSDKIYFFNPDKRIYDMNFTEKGFEITTEMQVLHFDLPN